MTRTKRPLKKTPHDPAREYIILIGAPSNQFNGYYRETSTGLVPQPAPTDSSEAEIEKYLTHPDPPLPGSHDLYWANFLYAAVKAVETRVIHPQPGDVLTLMVWRGRYGELPGQKGALETRIDVDNASSPNMRLSTWRNSTPYDPRYKASLQALLAAQQQFRPHTRPDPIVYSSAEPDIDHEIIMRTRADDSPGGFSRRPRQFDDYEHSIGDIPRRLVRGSRWQEYPPVTNVPELPEVQVKLLLVDFKDDILDYIATGTWPNDGRTGVRWRHYEEAEDEFDMGILNSMAQSGWSRYEKPKPGMVYPDWQQAPSVDRARVKIKRFDYFGHSGPADDPTQDSFWLEYGVRNKKGHLPKSEIDLSNGQLNARLTPALFAPSSYAKLWGCNLGIHMAPMLAQYVGTVVACRAWTTFEYILNDGVTLPTPSDPANPWITWPPGYP